MGRSAKLLSLVLLVCIGLAIVSCKPADRPAASSQPGANSLPQPTSSPSVSLLPTPTINPEDIEPTIPPSPTIPPVPTPLPTPVVTPLPVASPPFIPEVIGKTPQPFWIYYWQGNEVWRVDDQGKDKQLVIDTYKQLGQYLTEIPDPYKDSDCCWIGPRVVVSPDGNKLALVVVDKIKGVRGDGFTFSIYTLDIPTGKLKFVSKGQFPTWSPDSQQIAFALDPDPGVAGDGGLWIANLTTVQVYAFVKGDPTKPSVHVGYWRWSPDGQQIAYRFTDGIIDQTEIWIKNTSESSAAYLLPGTSDGTYYGLFSWMPDGKHLLGQTHDIGRTGRPTRLWAVSIQTGESKMLTQDFFGGLGRWSPDGKWMVFSAVRAYEQKEGTYNYDLWLLSADGTRLIRVTSTSPQDLGGLWGPDGTRLVFWRERVGLVTLSLQTGSVNPLSVNLVDDAKYDYAVGGAK